MTPSLTSTSAAQYEALRQHALERGRIHAREPLGAVIVVERGMAGWMRCWREVSGPTAAPESVPPLLYPCSCDKSKWQHELTVLLAEMTRPLLQSAAS
jgi:hypothetical protein